MIHTEGLQPNPNDTAPFREKLEFPRGGYDNLYYFENNPDVIVRDCWSADHLSTAEQEAKAKIANHEFDLLEKKYGISVVDHQFLVGRKQKNGPTSIFVITKKLDHPTTNFQDESERQVAKDRLAAEGEDYRNRLINYLFDKLKEFQNSADHVYYLSDIGLQQFMTVAEQNQPPKLVFVDLDPITGKMSKDDKGSHNIKYFIDVLCELLPGRHWLNKVPQTTERVIGILEYIVDNANQLVGPNAEGSAKDEIVQAAKEKIITLRGGLENTTNEK